MAQYVAFLRAINVGGRMVKMEALRDILTMPGIKNVSTYIQSGNLIFDSTESNKDVLTKKIETKLLKSLGFEVKTLVRSITDMESLISYVPFKDYPDDMALHVTFLSRQPAQDAIIKLQSFQTELEQIAIVNTEAYLLVRKGAYGETKLSNTFIEKKLNIAATTRNWATVNKMLEYKKA